MNAHETTAAPVYDILDCGPRSRFVANGKLVHNSQKINMQNLNQIKPITKRTPNGSLIMTPGGWSRLFKRAPDMSQIVDAERRVWDTKDCHVVGLRDVIIAPPGKRLVVADSSNIELRTGHLYCRQMDSSDLLARGEDLYCDFASAFYGRTITKADKKERQHGKVAELQLLYQSGAESFRRAARIMGGVRLNELEAQTTVDVYRAKRGAIKRMWSTGQKAIKSMMSGGSMYMDEWGLCLVEHNAIKLPNGMRLRYNNLRTELLQGFDGSEELQICYDDKEHRSLTKLYGGKLFQNVNQALARIVVFEQTAEIEKKYGRYEQRGDGVVMSTHDEAGCIVDEDRADECLEFMLGAMHVSPKWWPELVVKAEGDHGVRYSAAK